MTPTKEEAESKYTTASHDNPKRAYGRGYLRAIQELKSAPRNLAAETTVNTLIADETVDEFIDLVRTDGLAEAEKWFKREVKMAIDRAMLGTRAGTIALLESYVAEVKGKR